MIIKSLELDGYRNYEDLKIEFNQHTNIIHGNNAQGKTNILESIFVCGTTKSHRTNRDKELINFKREESHIRAYFEKNDMTYQIDMHLKKNKAKGIAVNGVSLRKAIDLYGIVNCVLFSPEDLNIIKNSPGERRKFLDILISMMDKVYIKNLVEYNKIIENRNKLLKDITYDKSLIGLLDVWDKKLCDCGKQIIITRKKFINDLKIITSDMHKSLTGNKEDLLIDYEQNVNEDDMENEVFLNRDRDLYLKNTSIGPHRDDLIFLINDIDIRKYGSQGQQRTAALSLKLAEIELIKKNKNTKPILLLDDVLSKLDSDRQNYLLNSIKDIQTIITCTGIDEFVKNRFKIDKVFRVEEGKVISES